ncbi:helix-turn-helix domain-containing protein [Streptomyces albiflavescens]|uniref:helix-turn-helix domain-containing protein n=1 Tax=Streptomyces albiflavescens TaxID=1623582 RepID=UPI001662EC0D|nr:XRE family transcriptional regulator [Streptomyces albiflavescens]
MPRWRALPDELDPQVREFASQLRRLVDRSGLSIAAVADRTGYSKTSWERYLNGRLLAPKGAIVALAEVTGTSPIHLTTMWELAERAWSRSEMRHDMTMEAIRISQARAALGEFGPTPAKGSNGRQAARKGGSATATPGIAGPAGVSPTAPPSVPSQPSGPDAGESSSYGDSAYGGGSRGGAGYGGSSSGGSSSGGAGRGGSWGAVASPSDGGGQFGPSAPAGPARSAGGPPQDARPGAAVAGGGARRGRRLTMFLAGIVGALVVIAVAVYLTSGGDKKNAGDTPKTPSTSASVNSDLPAGVKCTGAGCTGKDPENMGCGGELAKTTTSVTVGTTLVEVRYSETCGAAWARITQAAVGDRVEVSSGSAAKQTGSVIADTDAYTPMVAVKDAGDATACATLKSGQKGCTK